MVVIILGYNYLNSSVGKGWIEDKYIYYTDIEKSDDASVEYYLKKYDITTHEVESVAKTRIRSQSIFVLDDYVVFLHLKRSELTPPTFLGIILFTIIGLSLIILVIKKRKFFI